MEKELAPIRERAKELAADPKRVTAALERGAERARAIASKTLREVKQIMGLV